MHLTTGINRPPYEKNFGFLQVTSGCSHKKCTFCGYFKDCAFKFSPIDEIAEDIKEIPKHFGEPERIFLQSADAFVASYDILMKTAELIHKYVPSVKTIGGYARIDNFIDKSENQLREMKNIGYFNPYIGVESGDDEIKKKLAKVTIQKLHANNSKKMQEFLRDLTNETIFLSDHISMPFFVEAKLPKDKEILIEGIKKIILEVGEDCLQVERIYLVGADPFALFTKKLLERADLIKN